MLMEREVRKVGVLVLVMFVALFMSVSMVQVVEAGALTADPRNHRTVLDQLSRPRGAILVEGAPIVESVPNGVQDQFLRRYADGKVYAPVTGFFTPFNGAAGVESALSPELSGVGDAGFFAEIERLVSGHAPGGASVDLTLDASLQHVAYDALDSAGLTGSVVALDPSTGRILAMVSTPSYDPNALSSPDPAAVAQVYRALESDGREPLQNRAIGGRLNPPGSVFKLVTASAALESGQFTAESEFANPATIQLPGSDSVVKNVTELSCGDGAQATIATALRLSCNIPFVQLGSALGQERLRAMANAYGFNRELDIPLAVTPSRMRSAMSEAQVSLSAFGQDDVRATPLQIAMVSSAIANDGLLMAPQLIEAVRAQEQSPIVRGFEGEEFSRPISAETSKILTDIMVSGVEDGAAINAAIRGVSVAGKTGTAENGPDDPYSLWFTGFAPADNPALVVAVVIEDGGGQGQASSGSALAAPIGRIVLEAGIVGATALPRSEGSS